MTDVTRARGGDPSLAGHAKQESFDIARELSFMSSPMTVLVPKPDSGTGFHVRTLGYAHFDGMTASKEPQKNPTLPADDLLARLKDLDKPVTFVPQVYSGAAQRNVRFAVVLPKGFDPSKTYDVVAIAPDPPPGTTLARALERGELPDRIKSIPGAQDKIVVLPERLEHRRDAISNTEHSRLASAIVNEDIMPYLVEGFGAKPGKVDLHPFSDSTAVVDEMGGPSRTMGDFSLSGSKKKNEKRGGGGKNAGSLGSKLSSSATGIVLRDDWSASVVSAANVTDKVLSDLEGIPSKMQLEKLKGVKRSVMMLAITNDVPYAVIVPPNYDRERKEPYAVASFIPPAGVPFTKVVKELASKGGTHRDDTVVVVPLRQRSDASEADTRSHVEFSMLNAIDIGGMNVDLSRYSTATLSKDSSSWRNDVSAKPLSPVKLPAPIISVDGKWVQLPPTTNYNLAFPEAPKRGDTESIPKALQKQTDNAGTMFVASIKSKALDKNVRFATYLPPGYDPESKETYPVLVMLPGQRNPLSHWTSAGQIVPKLDAMMGGDAQKMIVVVAENTDSLWFNYETNGKGDFGKRDERDFEGHVRELIDYATGELKGDKSRLSIDGISRGGFGAVSLAARHPGVFKSVGAHAALLDLEHGGGVLGKNAETLRKQGHFGDADDPAWAKFNPGDLVRNGAFSGKNAPALFLDVGVEDPISMPHTMSFANLLTERGIEHKLVVASSPDTELKHNWDVWTGMLESWIAFAQSAHGKPGKASMPAGWKNDGPKQLAEHKRELDARLGAVDEARKTIISSVQSTLMEAEALLPGLADCRPYESLAGLREHLKELVALAPDIIASAKARVDAKNVPLHAAEHNAMDLAGDAQEFLNLVRRAKSEQSYRVFGEPIKMPKIDRQALEKIGGNEGAALELLIGEVPAAKDAILRLASARPELFTGEPDAVTKEPFGQQLVDFVNDGYLRKDEVDGFSEFLDRMAVKRFDWRVDGYSHSVCSCMNSVYNHPGIILDMIKAARDDKDYVVGGVYSGDGARKLSPLGDLKAGFRPVDWRGRLPPAQLGYERGFLRAIVDELAPSPHRLPDDRFASRADPVAVSLSKITGETVRYGYAFKMRSGEQIAKAVQSQGDAGLAMADVFVKVRGSQPFRLHFPVFYDYDAKTKTMALQEWRRPEQRIKVDEIEIVEHPDSKGAAIYYREDPALAEFLTPELQKNWDKIRPDRPKKKSSWFD